MNFYHSSVYYAVFQYQLRAFNSYGITDIQLVFHSCYMHMSFILRIVITAHRTNSTAFISLLNM